MNKFLENAIPNRMYMVWADWDVRGYKPKFRFRK